MVFLIAFPLFLLLVPRNSISIAFGGVAYIIICSLCQLRYTYKNTSSFPRLKNAKLSLILSVALSMLFKLRIDSAENNIFLNISSLEDGTYHRLTGSIAFMLGALSVFGVDYFIHIGLEKLRKTINVQDLEITTEMEKEEQRLCFRDLFILFISSIMIITLCSESSPLYPFNSWDDANCYLTVGKSMLKGLVPYKDLVEQKGPLLYTLHALAALVSFDSFLGVYILEIATCFLFMIGMYKTLIVFYERKMVLPLIPVFCAVVYSSVSFSRGDSAEEFCLPLLIYALYIETKAIANKKFPEKKEALLIGVTSGCVLWIKYTMLGFYIGWMIVPIYISAREKNFKPLLKMVLDIILGVMISTIPFILYFWHNHAIKDWIEVYFYNNIFIYSSTESSSVGGVIEQTWYGLLDIWNRAKLEFLMILSGIFWLAKHKNNLFIAMALSVTIMLIISVYGGGRRYIYYAFIFWIPALFSVGWIVDLRKYINIVHKTEHVSNRWVCSTLSLALSVIFIMLFSSNIKLIKFKKEDLPQYQVKSVISDSKIENPTLLNFGFLDGGFYTTTGIIPTCKYFCFLNTPLDEMVQMQVDSVVNGETDFVISQDIEFEFEAYDLIYTCDDPYSGYGYTYYLYKKQIE